MDLKLKSLVSARMMPMPPEPVVRSYGDVYVGQAHDIRFFPAMFRQKEAKQVGAILEEGQSSCFFHPNFPATNVCDVSGRMICDLCSTDWEGRTVSFESLQSLLGKEGKLKQERASRNWDSIALALCLLPLIIWPLTVVTAPVALFLALFHFRKGPTSVVRRSRWRFWLAGVLSFAQVCFWVFVLAEVFGEVAV